MSENLFRELQLLRALLLPLLAISAVGFFAFWARTRFWIPIYAHVLAVIGLVVGVLCVLDVPSDSPLGQHGLLARLFFALIFPAIVYFFFVFYGGQRVAYSRKPKAASEIADLIERFLNGTSLYPQEWEDFVKCDHPDEILDSYRRRCDLLDSRVNSQDLQVSEASEELRNIAQELRKLSHPH